MSSPEIPSVRAESMLQSYTWASSIPSRCLPGAGASSSATERPACVIGIDEAGRGPVLGPLVYGLAYCPASFNERDLKEIGFADSKALTTERRNDLLDALISNPDSLGWSIRALSPQDISAGMLRRRPHNLNAQSCEATVSLISGVLDSNIDVVEIFVDTVGDPISYARLLASYFPRHRHIRWTVKSKADAIYPIVGAASIAAKVTRDRLLEGWSYAERGCGSQSRNGPIPQPSLPMGLATSSAPIAALDDAPSRDLLTAQPSGKTSSQSGGAKRKRGHHDDDDGGGGRDMGADADETATRHRDQDKGGDDFWEPGSGYPSDPRTVAYLSRTLEPVFGYPGVVRFSWATVKTLLQEERVPPLRKSASSPSSAAKAVKLVGASSTKAVRAAKMTARRSSPRKRAAKARAVGAEGDELDEVNDDGHDDDGEVAGGADTARLAVPGSCLADDKSGAPSLPHTCTRPPPPGAKRAYVVRWVDEQATITSFFGGGRRGGRAGTAAAAALARQRAAEASMAATGVASAVPANALVEWMVGEWSERASLGGAGKEGRSRSWASKSIGAHSVGPATLLFG